MYQLRLLCMMLLAVLMSACTGTPVIQTPQSQAQATSTNVVIAVPTATTQAAIPTNTTVVPTVAPTLVPTAVPATPTAAPVATPTTRAVTRPNEAELITALQNVVDRRSAAVRARDKNGFDATIDQQNNRAFRRIQNEDWENGRAFNLIGGRVTKVEHTRNPEGYVKARIDFGGTIAYWTFRQGDDGIWRMTEPTNTELGARQNKEFEHFIVQYYAYDEALVERHAAVAEKAYAAITNKMKRTPAKKVRLVISPSVETMPGLAKRETLAFYTPGQRDALYIRSLESYLGGTVRGGQSDDEYLGDTIEHELSHLVHDTIVPLVKVPNWMAEGLAQFNCDCWYGRLPGAIASNQVWTLSQLDQAEFFERLRGNETQATHADILLAYDVSRTLVEYINQKYTIDKFWELNTEFASSRSMPEAVKKVLGIEYRDFEAQWLAWMKQTYAR